MKRQTIFKIITICFGLGIAVIIAELGFRFYLAANFHNLDDINTGKRQPINSPDKELTLGQVIQLSSSKRIIYELIPSSSFIFQKVPVQINSKGFRDKEYPEKKGKRTKRIIGIGDSIMFGWGVEEKDCYLTLIENQLNNNDSTNYEIINSGVPGYNTAMEVATLENKFDLDQVDLVLINYTPNDFDLPNFIQIKPDFATTQGSYILKHLKENNFDTYKGEDKRLEESPFDEEGWYESDPEKVPPLYKELVGKSGYKKAMERLIELSEKYNFKILMVSHATFVYIPDFVLQTVEELEIDMINIRPIWWEYKKQNPDARWKLGSNDYHPTVIGHQIIAKSIMEKIDSYLVD